MRTDNFSKPEKRLRHIASRRAHRQLMQVPWDRFHAAYEEYIEWQGFALWVRANVEAEGYFSARLEALLRKRCPSFVEEMDRSSRPDLTGLHLLSWVHNNVFHAARREGWLEALMFYGFRDIRSQGYWSYWEDCEKEWNRRQPKPFPTFRQWRRAALRRKLHDDLSCALVTKAADEYVEFETMLYWLRPLLEDPTRNLPVHVARELKKECPALLQLVSTYISSAYQRKLKNRQHLFNYAKKRLLAELGKERWPEIVLRQAHSHPRHLRFVDYAAVWMKSCRRHAAVRYPSFREWRQDAESYVRRVGRQVH